MVAGEESPLKKGTLVKVSATPDELMDFFVESAGFCFPFTTFKNMRFEAFELSGTTLPIITHETRRVSRTGRGFVYILGFDGGGYNIFLKPEHLEIVQGDAV